MSRDFLHVHFLPLLGLPLGELWDLDTLASDCATPARTTRSSPPRPSTCPTAWPPPPNTIAVR